MNTFQTTVGLSATPGGAGQRVDFDGASSVYIVITNTSAISIEYFTASAWTAIAPAGVVSLSLLNPDTIRLRKASGTGYPVAVLVEWSESVPANILSASAQFGINGESAADQSAALQELATWVARFGFNGTIQFPAGDIYHSAVIDWTGGKPMPAWFGSVNDRISYPRFKGAGVGATRMRFTTQGNLSSWRFWQTDAQVASGIIRGVNLRIEDIDFYGPGVAVQSTTLAAGVAAGAQTLSLTAAIAAVGDVIACRETGTDVVMWLPVLAVAGSGPQTVTFSNGGDTRRTLPATVFAGFSAAGRVLVFKQNRAIQIGGVSPTRSCITQSIEFNSCHVYDYFGGVALDDVTTFKAEGFEPAGCLFGFEHGYNIDTFTLINAQMGSDQPNFTFSATNGSPVITVSSNLGIRVGATLNEPGAVRNIHKHSVVLSVAGTTVTLSDPYTGTTGAGKSGVSHMGTLVAAGPFRSPFSAAFPTNTNAGGTNTLLINPVAGRIKQLVDWGDIVASGLVIQNPYVEVAQQLATLGYPGASGSGQIKVIGGKIEGSDTLTAPAIEDFRGVAFMDIDGVRGGGTANYPMVGSASTFSHVRLGPGWVWTNSQNGGAAIVLGGNNLPKGIEGQVYEYNLGFGTASGYGSMGGGRMASVAVAMAGSVNFNALGVSQYDVTVSAAGTLNVVDGGSSGHELTFVLQAAGAFIVTLGSNMYDAAGVSIGALPVSVNATGMALVFRAQQGGVKWRLVSGEGTGWA